MKEQNVKDNEHEQAQKRSFDHLHQPHPARNAMHGNVVVRGSVVHRVIYGIARDLKQPTAQTWASLVGRIVGLSAVLVGGPCVVVAFWVGSSSAATISTIAMGSPFAWLLVPFVLLLLGLVWYLVLRATKDTQKTGTERLFSAAFLAGLLPTLPLILAALVWKTWLLALCLSLCALPSLVLIRMLKKWAAECALQQKPHKQSQ